MGAVHPVLSGVDFKFMKVSTIILVIIMTLALKVLVLFTISIFMLVEATVNKKDLSPSRMRQLAVCWSIL